MFDLSLSGGDTGFQLDNEGFGEETDMTEKQGELFEVVIGLLIMVSRDCMGAVEIPGTVRVNKLFFTTNHDLQLIFTTFLPLPTRPLDHW